jgi:hypothetical protein
MATTSQKMMEIKFFVRMRGALTPPPRIDVPVMKMPLCDLSQLLFLCLSLCPPVLHVAPRCSILPLIMVPLHHSGEVTDQAAPTTDSPMQSAMPIEAQA